MKAKTILYLCLFKVIKKKIGMKKINITTGVLLIYLIVMSVWGWPGKQPDPDWVQYFAVMGVSVFVILLLRYLQVKRMKMRNKWKEENER